MIIVCSLFVSFVLAAVSGLHVYWCFGGTWGGRAALPTTEGRPLFTPRPFEVAAVALLLAAAAWFTLELGGLFAVLFPPGMLVWGGWALGVIFILRGIGEFRYLGLFKTKKGTAFARMDTVLYSPLCLLLGAAVLWMAVARA
ncbi:DUF3995 domain-containing protein [Paenibacillus chartarius]|uniref:DUF3995 domain-containing protein n=1 Tax=Paenibacillus chartarius TaxID=747481 RepID=A0ABV6DV32_9BACL